MRKNELSVLIPAYNTVCFGLVERLEALCSSVAEKEPAFKYEILVADDASTQSQTLAPNRHINDLPHCRFIERQQNAGSAATRNFLARESKYRWLLMLDCDMLIPHDDFISRYLDDEHEEVINGGIAIGAGNNSCLRYAYETACAPQHTAEQRRKRPYHSFRSTNFLIARQLMLRCPFDERFKKSGYEDVMLGKQLRNAGAEVWHTDNPTLMTDFEDNAAYVAKTEGSLQTLFQFRDELRGYSRLITAAEGIHVGAVRWCLRCWHRLFNRLERRNLCGRRPSLRVYKLYKLGYYLSLYS